MIVNAEGKKDSASPNQNNEQKNGKANAKSDDQKEPIRSRRGRNNNRGGNRNNTQNTGAVDINITENKSQEAEKIKADPISSAKAIKKISIETPQDVSTGETVDKKNDQEEKLPS